MPVVLQLANRYGVLLHVVNVTSSILLAGNMYISSDYAALLFPGGYRPGLPMQQLYSQTSNQICYPSFQI